MVIKSEEFFQEPKIILEDAYKFLGYNIKPDINIKVTINPTSPKIPMDSKLREQLENFFKPHNEKLLKHWGIDFIIPQKQIKRIN